MPALRRTVALVFCSALAACSAVAAHASPSPLSAEDDYVAATLAQLTLQEKVGQLFVTYAYGDSASTTSAADVAQNRSLYGVDNAAALISKYKLGGIIYFAWANNVNDPQQIAGLSNGLQQAAAATPRKVPLLVGTDQEQGIVTRVGPPLTMFPGSQALGAGRNASYARQAASISGAELKALGVNQDYAPDSDVNVNPANPVIGVRSFSSDPTLASQLASAQVQGYEADAHIASTAKHFPGHGDTAVDSHTGIPIINHTVTQWHQIDQPPFTADVAAGIDSIMTAHIIVPSLDPSGDPATLSNPIITGILRNQMHYDGVVITDSLGMAGVRQKYGDDRVPVLALKAGVDQLLMPPDLDLAYNSVLNAVNSGELTTARIDQSVTRILKMKYRLGLTTNPYVDPTKIPTVVGTAAHQTTAKAMTERSITLIKNASHTLPYAMSGKKVLVTGWGTTQWPGSADTVHTLLTKVNARHAVGGALTTGATPSQATINQAVAALQARDVAVVLTHNLSGSTAQRSLVQALRGTGKPVVVVGVQDPYDIAYVSTAATYLATYSYSAVSMDALAEVLAGEKAPVGKLPVTIPVAGGTSTLYPYGFGLGY